MFTEHCRSRLIFIHIEETLTADHSLKPVVHTHSWGLRVSKIYSFFSPCPSSLGQQIHAPSRPSAFRIYAATLADKIDWTRSERGPNWGILTLPVPDTGSERLLSSMVLSVRQLSGRSWVGPTPHPLSIQGLCSWVQLWSSMKHFLVIQNLQLSQQLWRALPSARLQLPPYTISTLLHATKQE